MKKPRYGSDEEEITKDMGIADKERQERIGSTTADEESELSDSPGSESDTKPRANQSLKRESVDEGDVVEAENAKKRRTTARDEMKKKPKGRKAK